MGDAPDVKVTTHTMMLKLDDLELDERNVNEETDDEFAGVVNNIRDFGFLDPVWVYPRGEKYRIISGNHRTQAARFLGIEEVPVVVFHIDDADVAQVVAIRANYARGKLSPAKFTKTYNELRRKFGGDALRVMMGINDEHRWKNLYRDVRAGLPPVVQRELDKTKHEITDVEDLARVIKNAVAKYGHNLESSFIFFEYSGQTHLTIKASDRAFQNIQRIADACSERKADINDYVNALLEDDDKVFAILEEKRG